MSSPSRANGFDEKPSWTLKFLGSCRAGFQIPAITDPPSGSWNNRNESP